MFAFSGLRHPVAVANVAERTAISPIPEQINYLYDGMKRDFVRVVPSSFDTLDELKLRLTPTPT